MGFSRASDIATGPASGSEQPACCPSLLAQASVAQAPRAASSGVDSRLDWNRCCWISKSPSCLLLYLMIALILNLRNWSHRTHWSLTPLKSSHRFSCFLSPRYLAAFCLRSSGYSPRICTNVGDLVCIAASSCGLRLRGEAVRSRSRSPSHSAWRQRCCSLARASPLQTELGGACFLICAVPRALAWLD